MKAINVLLVCAGGMSTSILMKKLQQYRDEQGVARQIKAVGLSAYEDVYQDYDVILMGPQVAYRQSEVEKGTGLPVAAIPPLDYAVGDSAHIFKLAENLV
ncbi:PTS system cellobiose-specific IIB component [Lactiplantibacillus plantarum]|nr:PTS system cellobiose-specific IIB component [Lactiplantibacillus plantarum]